jgi:protein SCO1/2
MTRPRRLAAAAALLALAATAACEDRASFRGVALDPPEPAPALRLAGADGDAFDLAAQRGSVVLLFFGYTRCPDVCPTTLAEWAQVRKALGDDAARVRFVFVSVDPETDTPAMARDYARRFDPSFVGLVADSATMTRLTPDFHLAAHAVPGEAGQYSMMHGSHFLIYDGRGRLRVMHTAGSTAEDVTADVRRLL